VVDLVYGPRGSEAVFASEPALNIVNQLFVYWDVSDNVKLTLGNFNTFLGYEVISPVDNFNYSTSHLFSYGPFSHTGLKADIDLGKGFGFMAGIFNPTDATDFNPNNNYTGGFQLSYSGKSGGIWLNSIISEDFFQFDITANTSLSDKVFVGFNASSASDNFVGSVLYFQYQVDENFLLGWRGEYFQDKGVGIGDNALTIDENVLNLTLSANYILFQKMR